MTNRNIAHGPATVGWHRSSDHHTRVKTKRRLVGSPNTGTGRSLILGFLLGLAAASFVSFLFISHHS